MADRRKTSDGAPTTRSGWLPRTVFVTILGLVAGGLIVALRADEVPEQGIRVAQASPTATAGLPVDPTPNPDTPDIKESGPGAETTTGLIVDVARAKQVIESIPVKGRAPKTGYDRERFGEPWTDTDDNSCDTRNDILARDLMSTTVTDGCIVEAGLLIDPFSGVAVNFERGPTSSIEVQIDHIVSLSNAWQTGAQQLSEQQRTEFANDPSNLLAVRGDLNLQKRDGDTATWLPPDKSFRCQFVAIQVLTKHKHGLWLTSPEKDAALRILENC